MSPIFPPLRISSGAISAEASLMPVFAARAQMMQQEPATVLKINQQTAAEKANGKQPPVFQWRPDFDSWQPSALYNGMIAPLSRLPIRGVI